jgi:AbrB family looped-hinge helix DNA binding protein
MLMKATITSKGQITIPQAIRKKLKLHAGTVLEFDEVADHLKATKCADPARMRSVIGIAKKQLAGKSTLDWLDELRGPVELPPRQRK